MTTGQRIKAARKKANMTQAELAQKLEIPFQSISQWERDIRKPKKETLESIAKELNVDPLELSDNLFDEAFLSALQNAFGFDEDFRTAFLSGDVELAILRSHDDKMLMRSYDMLNESGQHEAAGLVLDLTEKREYLNDRYTKTPKELKSQKNCDTSSWFPPPDDNHDEK